LVRIQVWQQKLFHPDLGEERFKLVAGNRSPRAGCEIV